MVDILLSSFFLYTLFLGTHRGFVEVIIKFFGVVIGLFLGFKYTPYIFSFLKKYFHAEKVILYFFSFSVIFIPVLSIFLFINIFFQKHIKRKKKLSFIDKALGGITATVLFVSFLIFINSSTEKYHLLKEIMKNSKIISYIKNR